MDRLQQIETFVAVAQRGSLSAAAAAEGVTPAVVSRRLAALETRLGVKLLVRTTRRLSLTFEGNAFLEDSLRILDELRNAEDAVSLGGVKASGHVRLTAPAGFGRRHVAPLLPEFLRNNPDVSLTLELSDGLTDIVSDAFDLAVRVGQLDDSSLVGIRLAQNTRVVVASPDYLARAGSPATPADLARHDCLTFGNYGNQARGWQFSDAGETVSMRVRGRLQSNDGSVLRDWAIAGLGLAWRSLWEVGEDIRAGRLVTVLDAFAAPANAIYAVFPQRRQLPLRVRMLIDHLKHHYGSEHYWRLGGADAAPPRFRTQPAPGIGNAAT
ncbi:MAG: LysR family transcriptional regulator [Burkholderiaceae bacterium]